MDKKTSVRSLRMAFNMAFKTLTVVDYDKETFEYKTEISDDEIAFIISEEDKAVYVWTGQNASIIKKYKAGTLATKIKSLFHFYGYKTQIVKQGEETGNLKEEVENLLQGQGTPAGEDAGLSTKGVETAAGATEQLKAEYETKIKALEEELNKLQTDNDALKGSIDAVTAEFESKIKYIDLEKEKLQGEIDAVRNENNTLKESYEAHLGDLRSEHERVISDRDALKAEMDSLRQDLEARNKNLESENNELKQDMAEKIQKIKEETIEKVKVNFFNMKALPSAPAGSVWFESIVQVTTGDQTTFPDLSEKAPIPAMKVKPIEKARLEPQEIMNIEQEEKVPMELPEFGEPSEKIVQEEPAVEKIEESPVKETEESAVEKTEELEEKSEENIEESKVELDFVNLEDEKGKRKKDDSLEFDVFKLE